MDAETEHSLQITILAFILSYNNAVKLHSYTSHRTIKLMHRYAA